MVKKTFLIILILVFVMVAGDQLIKYVTAANLVVATGSKSDVIKVEPELKTKSKTILTKPQQFSGGAHTFRLRPGKYLVSVYTSNGRNGSRQSVLLGRHQTKKLTLKPSSISNPQAVYGDPVNSVVADSAQLLFIAVQGTGGTAKRDGNLIHVDSSNNYSVLFPDHVFSEIKWASTQIGLAHDSENSFFLIRNEQLKQLKIPFTGKPETTSFAISPDEHLFISNGSSVYESIDGDNFKVIYTSKRNISRLAASKNGVAVVEEREDAGEDQSGNLTLVSETGKVTSKKIGAAFQAKWSPNGEYLFIGGYLGHEIYNSSLQKIFDVTNANTDNYTWLTDTKLLYSIDSQLWQYDINTKESTELTALAPHQSITSITVDSTRSYAYFETDNTEKIQLFRLGVLGHATDSRDLSLSIFLPITLTECRANYINFTQPVILISPFNDTASSSCLDTVKAELSSDNLDLGRYIYSVLRVLRQSD